MFIPEMMSLDKVKFYGLTKATPAYASEYISFMSSQSQRKSDVFFFKNAIIGFRDITVRQYVHLFFSHFKVVRQDTREYTFSEADFPNLNIDDIEWMRNELREWTNRPDKVQKAQLAIERFIRSQRRNSEIHDLMLGIESSQNRLNLEPPNQTLPALDLIMPYKPITKPELGTVYLNSKGEKKFFRCSDDAKYSDSTLIKISKKLTEERDRAAFRALQRNLFMDAGYEYDRIMKIIQYRLEYRNTMRRLESYRGLRKKGD